MLETETARPLGRGVFEVSGNFEYQTSSEGREAAVPFAAEYGLTDRLELLVEPVAWTAIRPKTVPGRPAWETSKPPPPGWREPKPRGCPPSRWRAR